MISVQTSQVTVTKAVTKLHNYFTVSENNFGSLHHVTFRGDELRRVLKNLDEGTDNRGRNLNNLQAAHGDIWNNFPFPGFVKIWEVSAVSSKQRSVALTFAQIGEPIGRFDCMDMST
jgi:hypothetical protein